MPRPAPDEHATFYGRYISLVTEEDILPALRSEAADTAAFLASVPAEEECKLHAPYTWTFRQVVGHLIDGERVFAYRALRFARGDVTPLDGFDENAYAVMAPHDRVPLATLATEYAALRAANAIFFETLDAAAWDRRGSANGAEISVRALAYVLVGHERHHNAILRKRLVG